MLHCHAVALVLKLTTVVTDVKLLHPLLLLQCCWQLEAVLSDAEHNEQRGCEAKGFPLQCGHGSLQ
jgi:hypothetical protein